MRRVAAARGIDIAKTRQKGIRRKKFLNNIYQHKPPKSKRAKSKQQQSSQTSSTPVGKVPPQLETKNPHPPHSKNQLQHSLTETSARRYRTPRVTANFRREPGFRTTATQRVRDEKLSRTFISVRPRGRVSALFHLAVLTAYSASDASGGGSVGAASEWMCRARI